MSDTNVFDICEWARSRTHCGEFPVQGITLRGPFLVRRIGHEGCTKHWVEVLECSLIRHHKGCWFMLTAGRFRFSSSRFVPIPTWTWNLRTFPCCCTPLFVQGPVRGGRRWRPVGVCSSHDLSAPLSQQVGDVDQSCQVRSNTEFSQLRATVPAGHNGALVGRSEADTVSSEEGSLGQSTRAEVCSSLSHRFSLEFVSGSSGLGDKEVVRQEVCCLGWDEDDLTNIAVAVRLMESHTAGSRGFHERDCGSGSSSAAAVSSWLRKLLKMFSLSC